MLKFDINLLFAIINIVIFFVLVRLVLFKPIMRVMDKRKELIQKQFDDAEKAEKEAYQLKDDYKARLDGVDEERNQMILEAKHSAKKEYDKILDRARTDADRVKSEAKKTAQLETEKARLAVNEQIAALAMETAQKVVCQQASAELDSSLYDKFLNESSDEE